MSAPPPPLVFDGDITLEDAVIAIVRNEHISADIVGVERADWIYASTSALEEVVVHLAGGDSFALLVKDFGRWAPALNAARDRREYVTGAQAEVDMYLSVLRPDAGSPRCYGVTNGRQRAWIFLEKVAGTELYQIGDMALWKAVARWLAEFHDRRAAERAQGLTLPASLTTYDRSTFASWIERAHTHATRGEVSAMLREIERHRDTILYIMDASPQSLIHGEFFPANVLVQHSADRVRICPIDWETAGRGPRVLDLAALVCGWDDVSRRELTSAYDAAQALDRDEQLDHLVDVASVLLAVQRLGSMSVGETPTHQARDWAAEARAAMNRLTW